MRFFIHLFGWALIFTFSALFMLLLMLEPTP